MLIEVVYLLQEVVTQGIVEICSFELDVSAEIFSRKEQVEDF